MGVNGRYLCRIADDYGPSAVFLLRGRGASRLWIRIVGTRLKVEVLVNTYMLFINFFILFFYTNLFNIHSRTLLEFLQLSMEVTRLDDDMRELFMNIQVS